jgi:hypothetical protein
MPFRDNNSCRQELLKPRQQLLSRYVVMINRSWCVGEPGWCFGEPASRRPEAGNLLIPLTIMYRRIRNRWYQKLILGFVILVL